MSTWNTRSSNSRTHFEQRMPLGEIRCQLCLRYFDAWNLLCFQEWRMQAHRCGHGRTRRLQREVSVASWFGFSACSGKWERTSQLRTNSRGPIVFGLQRLGPPSREGSVYLRDHTQPTQYGSTALVSGFSRGRKRITYEVAVGPLLCCLNTPVAELDGRVRYYVTLPLAVCH